MGNILADRESAIDRATVAASGAMCIPSSDHGTGTDGAALPLLAAATLEAAGPRRSTTARNSLVPFAIRLYCSMTKFLLSAYPLSIQ
jgi:hypothetical protein